MNVHYGAQLNLSVTGCGIATIICLATLDSTQTRMGRQAATPGHPPRNAHDGQQSNVVMRSPWSIVARP